MRKKNKKGEAPKGKHSHIIIYLRFIHLKQRETRPKKTQ